MAKQFHGNDHSISLDDAKKMVKNFKGQKDKIVKEEHGGKHLIPNCESFDRAGFDAILRREDCKGIRIYYGMKDDDLRVHAIIVGFDENGKDILPVAGIADGIEPPIIENGLPCPQYCPDSGSGLNGL